ncbi:helix-turn-helix domain-containing protein [Streptomyces sp. TRM76323]|uniref:Helix-turn-helix domain-containing protein n=1 Tax=Streptomyces tamarix TaxID=3078565 RepID=A0ABU3QV59_9ACTN|nr:helix-turn-helix domain-containing protein [Streptomyces tamarix]MDT9686671.1 helix-turn-helix domain-containing protein [Streptomyces tamarix]
MNHPDRRWTFLTSHARVLLTIARDPSARLRSIAAACQITERAVQTILADLEQEGYLHRRRTGRRNEYTLNLEKPFRHPAEAGLVVRALVELAAGTSAQPPKTASASVTVS